MYAEIDKDIYFNGCELCDKNCCSGIEGPSLTPLILDDFKEVYKNFAIVFGVIDGNLKALMVLNKGENCKYLINGKCSIYQNRPPACKLYPISPYFDKLLVDTSCPSVNYEYGEIIVKNNIINSKFYHNRIKNFQDKLKETNDFLNSIINDDFKFLTTIRDLPLFQYIGKKNNSYLTMHLESLKHL